MTKISKQEKKFLDEEGKKDKDHLNQMQNFLNTKLAKELLGDNLKNAQKAVKKEKKRTR